MTLLLASFVLLVVCGFCAASAAGRPNSLLIVSEDNGPELGCYGEPYVKTPVLDNPATMDLVRRTYRKPWIVPKEV